MESAVAGVRAERGKKLLRARRQWEQDDRVALEKAARGKVESMQKAAAEEMKPRLEVIILHVYICL